MEMKERILYVRENSGLNQEAFAQRIGVTKSAISGYETGRRDPSPQVLHSISREFRYNLDWLKTGEGEPEVPDPNDILDELFHRFSCSDFERAFLEAYFDLQDDEREQFCAYLERVFGSAVQGAKKRREEAATFAAASKQGGFVPHGEADREELHAELDHQLDMEKEAAEKSEVS